MFNKADKHENAAGPIVETLEQRRLLSVSLHGGMLAIKGTKRADDIQIEVAHSSVMVTMNGSSKSFNLSDIRKIRALGGKGNDNIHFNSAGGTLSVPMTLMGGVGNDTLVGGSGDDVLKGGAGDDSIQGNAGDDSCDGGAGNDSLEGSSGDDDLEGGAGNDDCDGGQGHDSINGGKGSDHFHSDDAENEIEDKQGNDDDQHDDDVTGGGDNGSDDV